MMIVAPLPQAGVGGPIVRHRERSRLDGAFDEIAKLFGAPVGHDSEPDTPGVASILSRVLRGPRLTMAHLDGAGDEDFVMHAPALAACPSADPCLVHFDILAGPTTDPVLVGLPHHRSAELMQKAEGGLVTREPELALELLGGNAGRRLRRDDGRDQTVYPDVTARITRNEIGRPPPNLKPSGGGRVPTTDRRVSRRRDDAKMD